MKLLTVFLALFIGAYCLGQQYIYPDSLQGYYPFGSLGDNDQSGNNFNPTFFGNFIDETVGNSAGYYWFSGLRSVLTLLAKHK
ncbi:hypothetical protein N9355_08185 [Crocinitomicaceae bacterium]|jgi:hypothetical protein|nr:hypothetical protein [Crocinitomicaceae bacterium]